MYAALIDEYPKSEPSVWSDELGPIAKGLGWGCLLLLALPIAYVFYFALTFCENNCS